MNFDKILENDTNVIDTEILKVTGNLISWKNTILQIINISMISTTDITKQPFPLWSLLLALIGIIAFSLNPFIAILLLAVSVGWIYLWYKKRSESKKHKRLNIVLNSGSVFSLVFEDQEFLDKVISVLTEILSAQKTDSNITFNIKNSTYYEETDNSVNYNIKDNTFNDESAVIKE